MEELKMEHEDNWYELKEFLSSRITMFGGYLAPRLEQNDYMKAFIDVINLMNEIEEKGEN